VAARLDTPQISEILKVISPDTFERPIYAGNVLATVQSLDAIKVATVRTSAFPAAAEQAQAAHAVIRKTLGELWDTATAEKVRIQYGGSVKPQNAAELMHAPDIDGALVGGASLEPRGFAEIVKAARV
jgi:electron transfer flavoprotein alpha subunit